MSDPNLPDKRNASRPLWRRVRAFICELFNICGEPQELAAKHTLVFRDYKILLPWLRAGEALLRRFLLLEAALLEPSATPYATPAPAPAASKQSPQRAAQALDLDNPASWRVSFRTTVADRRLPGGVSCLKKPRPARVEAPHAGWKPALRYDGFDAPRFRATLPLARRLEAILRVYNNPLPFARRLAARLRKSASSVQRVLNDAWDKSRNLIGRDLHAAMIPCIEESVRLLTDSS